MRRTILSFIGIIVSLVVVSVVLAVPGFDDRGNPNDPRVNERANACYDGGTLEGKCHTQVEWDAGWYLIRFQYGLLGRSDIPAEFAWILPSLETPDSTPLPTKTPLPPL